MVTVKSAATKTHQSPSRGSPQPHIDDSGDVGFFNRLRIGQPGLEAQDVTDAIGDRHSLENMISWHMHDELDAGWRTNHPPA